MCSNKKRKYYHFYLNATSRKLQKLIPSKIKTCLFQSQILVPANHKKRLQSAKLNSHKNLVPHGIHNNLPLELCFPEQLFMGFSSTIKTNVQFQFVVNWIKKKSN